MKLERQRNNLNSASEMWHPAMTFIMIPKKTDKAVVKGVEMHGRYTSGCIIGAMTFNGLRAIGKSVELFLPNGCP